VRAQPPQITVASREHASVQLDPRKRRCRDPIFWDDLFPVPPPTVEEQIAKLGQVPGSQAQPSI
jgi:hypothetical protein